MSIRAHQRQREAAVWLARLTWRPAHVRMLCVHSGGEQAEDEGGCGEAFAGFEGGEHGCGWTRWWWW